MKEKLKKKSFWLSMAGAGVLALQFLGVKIDAPYLNEIISGVCAVLILFGLVKDDTKTELGFVADDASEKELSFLADNASKQESDFLADNASNQESDFLAENGAKSEDIAEILKNIDTEKLAD